MPTRRKVHRPKVTPADRPLPPEDRLLSTLAALVAHADPSVSAVGRECAEWFGRARRLRAGSIARVQEAVKLASRLLGHRMNAACAYGPRNPYRAAHGAAVGLRYRWQREYQTSRLTP